VKGTKKDMPEKRRKRAGSERKSRDKSYSRTLCPPQKGELPGPLRKTKPEGGRRGAGGENKGLSIIGDRGSPLSIKRPNSAFN